MKKKTVETAKEMLNTNKKIDKEKIVSLRERDPIEVTKANILNFIDVTLQRTEQDRELKSVVADAIKKKIEEEIDDISIGQLAGLFETLGEDITASTDSVLGIIKPIPNAVNYLLERSSVDEEGRDKFIDASSKDMRNLKVLADLVNGVSKAQSLNAMCSPNEVIELEKDGLDA